jgi:hypothetical protein
MGNYKPYAAWTHEEKAAHHERSIKYRKTAKGRATKRRAMARRGFQAKLEMIKQLGGACVCCGEKQHQFLTLDHINNDGYIHRSEHGYQIAARLAKEHNYSPTKFQLLCFNCNSGRAVNGGICPHKEVAWLHI